LFFFWGKHSQILGETAQILFLKTLQVIVLEDVHFFLIVLYKSHIPKASEGNVFTFFFIKSAIHSTRVFLIKFCDIKNVENF
jgi:hypothetical protein